MISLKHIIGSIDTVQSEGKKQNKIISFVELGKKYLGHKDAVPINVGAETETSTKINLSHISSTNADTGINAVPVKTAPTKISLGHIISSTSAASALIPLEVKKIDETIRVRPNAQFLARFVGSRERFNDSITDQPAVPEDLQLTC